MVTFHPFSGYTPKLSKNEQIIERVSPPYDVIGPEELKKWQSYPHNVTRVTLGGVEGTYDEAGRILTSWISSGALVRDASESFYLYVQEFDEAGKRTSRLGLIGILAAEGYDPKGVIPHEETFPKVKEDRLNLLRGVETHCESIFGIVDSFEPFLGLMRSSAELMSDFVDPSGVKHSLLRIADPGVVSKVRQAMSGKRMLIADGHHRYETACKYALENKDDKKKGFVLATIVSTDDPGLIVRPTHRLISGLVMNEEALMQALSRDFALSKARSKDDLLKKMATSGGRDLGLATRSGDFVLLRPKKEGIGALENLDTYVCEENIIKPIVQAKEGTKIAYDHDLESALGRLRSGEFDYAVILSPPSLDVIWSVALDGKKMPKKSTYFWPKMWSGLMYYRMR